MASPLRERGHKKLGGRVKGTPNALTKTVKETVLAAFNELQSDPKANLTTWGRNNPHLFYPIAAKLIPTEIAAKFEGIIINVTTQGE